MASLMSFISKNHSNRRTNEFPRLEIYRQGRAVEGRESDSFALLLFGLLDVLHLSKALESTCQRKPEVVENRRQVMAVEGPESDSFAQLFDGLVNVPHLSRQFEPVNERTSKSIEIPEQAGAVEGLESDSFALFFEGPFIALRLFNW